MKKFLLGHRKEMVLWSILLLQLVVAMVYNLTMLRYQADFDSSSGMLQVVEIWRQKTFLIRDWAYQTTVGWDIPLPLAVLFYGLTKDVFVSMGIANNLIILLYVYVFYDILKRSGGRTKHILVALIVLFVPYTTGQLGYFPMLFIGTASYSIKVLITLLLVDILVRLESGLGLRKSIGQLILFLLFSLLSALSSGVYMLACGVLPVFLYLILKVLYRGQLRMAFSKHTLVAALGVAAFLGGVIWGKFLGLENNSYSMVLLSAEKLTDNALRCFTGIWELFGAVKENNPPLVISKDGIICLLGVVITALILFVIVYYGIRFIQRREKRILVGIILCVVFVNLCVLLLTDTTYSANSFEYRYHIVSMVPAILLVGVFFQDISVKVNALCRNTILLVVVFACILIGGDKFSALYAERGTGLINDLGQITDIAKEQGTDLIYVIAMDDKSLEAGRLLRVCDFDINVSTLADVNHGTGWGGSSRYFENGRHEGKVMVMVTDKNRKKMPKYLTSRMTEVGEVLNYRLYVCEENIFDCSAEMPKEKNEKTIDFPYSPWYILSGKINNDGELVVDGEEGIVMYGSQVEPSDGFFDIRLKYRVDETKGIEDGQKLGVFGIYGANDDIKAQVEIIAGQECVLNGVEINEEMGMLHYSVIAYPGSSMLLESIVAEKTK